MKANAIFPGWRVVIGSGFGIPFSSQTVFASGFAILASAMAGQFGWSQPEVARAATTFLLVQMVMHPVIGWQLDRWGSRVIASGSIVAFAVALVALSEVDGSLLQFYLAFAVLSVVSTGTSPLSYARAIALWFNRRRGLALGLAGSSQAVGFFILPVLTQKGIAHYGWSATLCALAGFEVAVCLPVVAWLVRSSPEPYGLHPDGDPAAAPEAAERGGAGMGLGTILRTGTFWKLAAVFAIMGLSYYALTANIVYILTKTSGMTVAGVAQIQALAGLAVLFGRVGFGFLLDRLHAPFVGVLVVLCMATTALAYAVTSNPTLIATAAVLSGLAIGGDTDLMPYLASRYFGTHSISKVYGWFLFGWFLGSAVGPVAFAQLTSASGGPELPLILLAALQAIPVGLFLSLGRYSPASAVKAGFGLAVQPTPERVRP